MLLFSWLDVWSVLDGWVGWRNVCRDMEDVRGFEVKSFILGCQLPLPPLLSPVSLSQSTFVLGAEPVFAAPKTLGQPHSFSCCLAADVWPSAVCVRACFCGFCGVRLDVGCSHMQTSFKSSVSVRVHVTLHFNFKVWL